MKRILKIVISIVLLVGAVSVGGSFYFLDYALKAKKVDDPRSDQARFGKLRADFPDIGKRIDSLYAVHVLRDTFVLDSVGNRHHAYYMRSDRANGRVAVLVHGYTARSEYMLPISTVYMDMGYNVLLPDLHGHGLTEGDDIQMGWFDRLDVLDWIRRCPGIFPDNAQNQQIVVHGVSMGAATTMCLSGEVTPKSVKCFVEDCGYTSVWEEFSSEMKARFGLPRFPLMYTTSWLCGVKKGWTFDEASPLNQVKKCQKPMMFIHGDEDTFVPTAMVHELYAAKEGTKELWVTEKTAHAQSFGNHREEYAKRVSAFVGRYIH